MIGRLKIVAFAVAAFGFAAMVGAYHLGFERVPLLAAMPEGGTRAFSFKAVQGCLKDRALALFGDATARRRWSTCDAHLAAYGADRAFDLRTYAVAGWGMVGLISLFGFAVLVHVGRPAEKVVRGARLLTGAAALEAFAKASRRECRCLGRGLEFLSPVPISRDRECRHFLMCGSVGGGKTQTMLHLILEAISREDGVLVLDTKGDMMAGLPGQPGPLLVAPHDRRSLVWDVAADCRVKQDARELAARFIPPSHDPMWSQAAQEIFVACVVHLQATRGAAWTWSDLEREVTADIGTLTARARAHNPNALRLLGQPDSKTTHSILTTFQTHMRIVSVLADAWADHPAKRFSIRQWLHRPTPRRPLILQHDPGYPELSRIWIGSLLGLLASAVGSPALAESRERRIWLFLDEFPQLPAIRQFPAFLELGRSKGVAVVIGAQDPAQIRAVYGADQALSWFGMIGTKVFTRINVSEAAEEASRLIGMQDVERRTKSTTRSAGRRTVTTGVHRESRRVVTASEIATRLGPTGKGLRVLFVGLGDAVYELEMPYITLPELRPPAIPADWTRTPPTPPGAGPNGSGPARPQARLTGDVADLIRRTRH